MFNTRHFAAITIASLLLCLTSAGAVADEAKWDCREQLINNRKTLICKSTAASSASARPASESVQSSIQQQPATGSAQTVRTGQTNPPTTVSKDRAVSTAARPESLCSSQQTTAAAAPKSRPDFDEQDSLPVETSADTASLVDGVAHFEGNVEIVRGNATLLADSARYNSETEIVELTGNVSMHTPAAVIQGNHASMNMSDNSSSIDNARYETLPNGMRGTANRISMDAEQRVQIQAGSYTRCQPDNKVWAVQATDITLDKTRGHGSARHARLELYNVPVFYTPYAQFPVGDRRQSGFLFPSLSDTSDGFDLALPYYLNIAPNFDATISPRYKKNNGYITEASVRWLNHFDQWEVGGAYIDSDESLGEQSRWIVNVDERSSLNSHNSGITTRIDFTDVSDSEYLRDLNTTSLSVNRATHLDQSASISYQGLYWSAGSSIQKYETVVDNLDPTLKPYQKRPELWLALDSTDRPFRLGGSAAWRYTSFDRADTVDGERSYAEATVNFPMRWTGLELLPEIGAQQLDYQLKNPGVTSDDKRSFGTAFGSLDIKTVFEKTGATRAIRTLEPRLFYLYRKTTSNRDQQLNLPAFDSDWLTVGKQQLTRSSRFGGYDRIEETNQLSASITHRVYNARGEQRAAATIGQVYYFQQLADQQSPGNPGDQRITRRSALIMDADIKTGQRLQTLASLLWDTENSHVEQGSIGFRYRAAENSVANLGYSYRRRQTNQTLLQQSIEQVDFSAVTSVSRHWGLVGRYQYDLINKRSTESLGGLEYDSCCVKLRLVYRDGLIFEPEELPGSEERDRSIFLQIQLKGLMGVGNSLENVLEESVFGYKQP